MKKWLKWLIVPVLAIGIAGYAISASPDGTRPISNIAGKGHTASYLVQHVIDSSTTVGLELRRKVITVPVATVAAGADTVWTALFTVPSGYTYTLKGAWISGKVEASGVGVADGGILYYNAGTLDTCVTGISIDADSVAYDNTPLALTRVDSVFNETDVAYFWFMCSGASTAEGVGITLDLLIDE